MFWTVLATIALLFQVGLLWLSYDFGERVGFDLGWQACQYYEDGETDDYIR